MRLPFPPPSSAGRILLIAITAVGLVLAQLIDVTLTASGLVFLDVALTLPVLGRWGTATGMALVLQATVLSGDLVVANVGGVRQGRPGRVAFVVALGLLVPAIGYGTMLHYAQLANLAHGAGLLDGLQADVRVLQTRVTATDQRFQRAWREAIATQELLAGDSAAGRDQTRVASCGPLCRDALVMGRRLKAEFAPLGEPIPVSEATTVGTEAGYAGLLAAIDAVRPKALLQTRMCSALGRSCEDPLASLLADPALARLQAAFGGTEKADRRVLVLHQVDADARALLSGQVRAVTALLLGLVLLLPGCELSMVVFLRLAVAARRSGAALMDLREQEMLLDEEMELETRIAAKQAFRDTLHEPAI